MQRDFKVALLERQGDPSVFWAKIHFKRTFNTSKMHLRKLSMQKRNPSIFQNHTPRNVELFISDDDFTINECGDTQWAAVLEQEERRLEALKIENERQ
jgi:hypothetical protein